MFVSSHIFYQDKSRTGLLINLIFVNKTVSNKHAPW